MARIRCCRMNRLLCGLLSAVCCTSPWSGRAQPATLYKEGDLATARANVRHHPWARRVVRGWRRRADFALQQDKDFFVALIPDLTPGCRYGQTCPACVDPVARRGEREFRWQVNDPERVACRRCGIVFPHPDYPENGVLECRRMGQRFTYYQTPAERALGPAATDEERAEHALLGINNLPAMVSMSGLARFHRVQWSIEQALLLAKLYALEGDARYAERSLWILERLAEVFPNYLYISYIGSVADWPPAKVAASMGDPTTPRGGRFPPDAVLHPYGLPRYHRGRDAQGEYSTLHNGFWGAGRISRHGKGSDAGPLLRVIVAYDLVRGARDAEGRPLASATVRERIERDLIAAGADDYEHWNDLNNKSVAVFSLSAAAGMLLGEPARVHRAYDGWQAMLAERFHFDGFSAESPGYGLHTLSNAGELPDLLTGYSDPPGYRSPSGARLDALNAFREARYERILLAHVRMLAPGLRLPVLGDTAHERELDPHFAEVLAARLGGRYAGLLEELTGQPWHRWGTEYSLWYRTPELDAGGGPGLPLRSEWFPGWHVGVLRGGTDLEHALFLNGNEHHWTLRTSHRQADLLSISTYAYGREMASDRGYFSGSSHRTPDGRLGREWTSGTLSHNLVVVDESHQARRACGTHLELFGRAPGVAVVQAAAEGVYPRVSEYRRTCAMVHLADGGHYLIDFFRVTGGALHQYTFHSNGALTGMSPAEPAPVPVSLSPAWDWVARPRAVYPSGPSTFTWQHDGVGLDLWVLNALPELERITIVDAPGWRHHGEARAGRPPIQQILVERRNPADATDALVSCFVTLQAPYKLSDEATIKAAEILPGLEDGEALGVRVRLADRTDYFFSARDQEPRTYGPIRVAGAFAFLSLDREGNVRKAYVLDGTLLAYGDLLLESDTPHSIVDVGAVDGKQVHLAAALPGDLAASAAFVLLDGPEASRPERGRLRTGWDIESLEDKLLTVRAAPVPAGVRQAVFLHALHWPPEPPGSF